MEDVERGPDWGGGDFVDSEDDIGDQGAGSCGSCVGVEAGVLCGVEASRGDFDVARAGH